MEEGVVFGSNETFLYQYDGQGNMLIPSRDAQGLPSWGLYLQVSLNNLIVREQEGE